MSSCKFPACLTRIFFTVSLSRSRVKRSFMLYLVDGITASPSRKVPIGLLSCCFFAEETRPVFLHRSPWAGFGWWRSWGVFEHVPLSFTFLINWHSDEKLHGLDFYCFPLNRFHYGGGDIYPKAGLWRDKQSREMTFPEVAFGTLPAS